MFQRSADSRPVRPWRIPSPASSAVCTQRHYTIVVPIMTEQRFTASVVELAVRAGSLPFVSARPADALTCRR